MNYETIVTAVRKNTVNFPDRTALVYDSVAITWSKLNELTDSAASELIKRGVKHGETIGISASHGGLGILAILAVIKSGAAYLPLNPLFPKARLEYMLNDAGVKCTLSESDITQIMKSNTECELPEIIETDRFAVMYTSGSTGKPKPAVLLHRDAVPYARQYIELTGLSEEDAMGLYSGFCFVLHVADIYAWAFSGAAIHVIPSDVRLDVSQLINYFDRHKISVVAFPTAFGRKFLSEGHVNTLRTVTMVGEKLIGFECVDEKLKVFNAYGCTECAGGISIGEIKPDDIHVGKESPDTIISIVDENGVPVLEGEKGELWVSRYGNIHKSGDLARRNKDGNIEIVGRTNFQLNVRGYRVDPSEIESCLTDIPGIIESVAVERENRIVLYYCSEYDVAIQTIKDHLMRFLPLYMIPATFMRLDRLPRNLNGKIDRALLPDARIKHSESPVPKTDTEKKLADIWRSVLNLEKNEIYLNDSFSDLGGDSLSLVVLSAEIENVFGITITPAEASSADLLSKQVQLIENSKSFSPLFIFRDTGEKPPIFFLHSANTGPEVYEKFFKSLPDDQPLYAFEHRNLLCSEHLSIRELAVYYLKKMRKLFPDERIKLAGWSLGGLIAFEMALISEEMGLQPLEIYLVDPQILNDKEKTLNQKLDASPYYIDYLKHSSYFSRYQETEMMKKLIQNNIFMTKEAVSYRPERKLHSPVRLYRATVQDSVDNIGAAEAEILNDIWKIKPQDNGFGIYCDNLTIINIDESHDRILVNQETVGFLASDLIK